VSAAGPVAAGAQVDRPARERPAGREMGGTVLRAGQLWNSEACAHCSTAPVMHSKSYFFWRRVRVRAVTGRSSRGGELCGGARAKEAEKGARGPGPGARSPESGTRARRTRARTRPRPPPGAGPLLAWIGFNVVCSDARNYLGLTRFDLYPLARLGLTTRISDSSRIRSCDWVELKQPRDRHSRQSPSYQAKTQSSPSSQVNLKNIRLVVSDWLAS